MTRRKFRNRRDEIMKGPLRLVGPGEFGSTRCPHIVELGPTRYHLIDEIVPWARQNGLLGVVRSYFHRHRGNKETWGIACANPDTAFAIKMRWV